MKSIHHLGLVRPNGQVSRPLEWPGIKIYSQEFPLYVFMK